MTPRHIVIVTVGPRGDVHPYCLLGQALAAQGHTVTIATEKRLESLVSTEFKLPFRCIAGDVCGGLFDPDFQHRFRVARALKCLEMLTQWNERFDQAEILASYEKALADADLIVCGALSVAQSYSIAEKHRATWVPLFLGNCLLPTSAFPHWILAGVPFSYFCSNKWSHTIVATKVWLQQRHRINRWRASKLKLPPITSPLGILDVMVENPTITVYQACSLLCCGPKRQVPADYTPGKVVYGGFVLPDAQSNRGSPVLQRFLKTSTLPLIYMGFGGMPTRDPLGLLQLAVKVSAKAKCQCVVVASWAADMPPECDAFLSLHQDTLCVQSTAPHAWLFPQMRCIVHHAGFLTTATALRSGVPQIPCPVVMDQFHHANEMVALGVAPAVVGKGALTSTNVASLVKRVLGNAGHIQTKAKELGAFVASESHGAVAAFCHMILSTPPTFATRDDATGIQ
ncbi:Aste57867_18010 [Aphanomyces stellatus]|uniref:Aste57867_18010 protein n=1 Tax=Aphanomyces stellatus TaxID=120398 RepID=A0A485LCL7_9STRA|nr:hypothetical protein As57867_017948 [Aphanomyces stellatus]VFT94749.1 Aste57867_18010 [Aphanomyces stellatus]